jgi:hypothetical protein
MNILSNLLFVDGQQFLLDANRCITTQKQIQELPINSLTKNTHSSVIPF